MDEHRCKKCGKVYECVNFHVYMSKIFCPDCRDPIADDVHSAEIEAYNTYRAEGDSHWKAEDKAHEFAMSVGRERIKRGR